MEEIKCTSYEKRDFIRFLEYAKEMKRNTMIKKGKFDDREYDIERIELLIKRCKGIEPKQDYIRNSVAYSHENNHIREKQYNKHEEYEKYKGAKNGKR